MAPSQQRFKVSLGESSEEVPLSVDNAVAVALAAAKDRRDIISENKPDKGKVEEAVRYI